MKKIFRSLWQLLRMTVRKLTVDHVGQHAAALAFYALFSLIPILLIVVSLGGFFFGEEATQGKVFEHVKNVIGLQPAKISEGIIRHVAVGSRGLWTTIIGSLVLLISSSTVFNQLKISLNVIWSVRRDPEFSGTLFFLRSRFLSLLMVLIIGLILLASLVLTAFLASFGTLMHSYMGGVTRALSTVNIFTSYFLVVVFFAIAYKMLPDVKVRWREVGLGATLSAFLFWCGKYGVSLYLQRSNVVSFYGAAGSLVILLLWIYYSAFIFYLGATFTQVYTSYHLVQVEPRKNAVKIIKEIVKKNEKSLH